MYILINDINKEIIYNNIYRTNIGFNEIICYKKIIEKNYIKESIFNFSFKTSFETINTGTIFFYNYKNKKTFSKNPYLKKIYYYFYNNNNNNNNKMVLIYKKKTDTYIKKIFNNIEIEFDLKNDKYISINIYNNIYGYNSKRSFYLIYHSYNIIKNFSNDYYNNDLYLIESNKFFKLEFENDYNYRLTEL